MAERKVELVFEGFGNKNLKERFALDEIGPHTLDQALRRVLEDSKTGSNTLAYKGLMRKLETSSGNYTPQVATRAFLNGPVSFVPARKDELVSRYLTEQYAENKGQQIEVLRIAITPAHVVAYR